MKIGDVFLSPLQGWIVLVARGSHGLRRGLRSYAPPGLLAATRFTPTLSPGGSTRHRFGV